MTAKKLQKLCEDLAAEVDELLAERKDLLEALELLCDEICLAMPADTAEFNGENIWRAEEAARAAIARAQGKG